MRLRSLLLAGAAAIFAATGLVQANTLTPTLVGVTGAGPYLWTYTVDLSATSKIVNTATPSAAADPDGADFFTIYDFAGYVAGSVTVSNTTPTLGWAPSVANLGKTPTTPPTGPSDSAGIPNLSFTYIGSTTQFGPLSNFITVTALSTLNQQKVGQWTSSDTKDNPTFIDDNTPQSSTGSVIVPTAVPLPAAAWAGMVLLGGLGLNKVRKNRA